MGWKHISLQGNEAKQIRVQQVNRRLMLIPSTNLSLIKPDFKFQSHTHQLIPKERTHGSHASKTINHKRQPQGRVVDRMMHFSAAQRPLPLPVRTRKMKYKRTREPFEIRGRTMDMPLRAPTTSLTKCRARQTREQHTGKQGAEHTFYRYQVRELTV